MRVEARRTKPPEWFTESAFIEMRDSGYRMNQIAKLVFASEPTLRRWLTDMGVPKQMPGRKKREGEPKFL